MAKAILKPLAPPDSPIYSQPLSIGARLTKAKSLDPVNGIDPQNIPSDPSVEVASESQERTKSSAKK